MTLVNITTQKKIWIFRISILIDKSKLKVKWNKECMLLEDSKWNLSILDRKLIVPSIFNPQIYKLMMGQEQQIPAHQQNLPLVMV
jgi:hypothetical protein